MSDPLVTVTVRIPAAMTERVRRLAEEQDRTVQAIYTRAIRLGLDLEEERHRIACEAIRTAERRRAATPPAEEGGASE